MKIFGNLALLLWSTVNDEKIIVCYLNVHYYHEHINTSVIAIYGI